MSNAPLSHLLERWSRIALEEQWVDDWTEGAIFPRELVFFVARCEQFGIQRVVESGRQQGYSTGILARFAELTQGQVDSIDFEDDVEIAEACRRSLRHFKTLNLLKGDTRELLGETVHRFPRVPTAILCDGPKGYTAIALLFAAAGYKWVKLIAQHNLQGSTAQFFSSFADCPCFYEEYGVAPAGAWRELTQADLSHCLKSGAARSLEQSSLGVMTVSDLVRRRVSSATHPSFQAIQPRMLRFGWNCHIPLLGFYVARAVNKWRRVTSRKPRQRVSA